MWQKQGINDVIADLQIVRRHAFQHNYDMRSLEGYEEMKITSLNFLKYFSPVDKCPRWKINDDSEM